jgi:hypothetical protein
MRYSSTTRLAITKIKGSNRELLQRVARDTEVSTRTGGIVLVGGIDSRSLAIRQAQACMRLDQLPSAWSHAALVLDWSGSLDTAIGAEVSLDPEEPAAQVPERNGVTLVHLTRFLDAARYPNLAVITVTHPNVDKDAALRDRLRAAALDPNRERLRYPFMDWLGEWAKYSYTPTRTPNPLTQGVPVPGASFCEYVYEAAGLDVTPGATAPNACPELIWATALYWHNRLGVEAIRVNVWSTVRHPKQDPRPIRTISLNEDLTKVRQARHS